MIDILNFCNKFRSMIILIVHKSNFVSDTKLIKLIVAFVFINKVIDVSWKNNNSNCEGR